MSGVRSEDERRSVEAWYGVWVWVLLTKSLQVAEGSDHQKRLGSAHDTARNETCRPLIWEPDATLSKYWNTPDQSCVNTHYTNV